MIRVGWRGRVAGPGAVLGATIAVAMVLSARPAPAGADESRAIGPVATLPAYAQECGACHLAYPPGLLPAASWRRLMDGLTHHFGSDASLDAAVHREISAWLAAHAGTARKLRREPGPPPEDRITRSAWFVREHREVPAATWKRASIGSPANCAACHPGTAAGRFEERDIRIPK